jgi:hypothetical protein
MDDMSHCKGQGKLTALLSANVNVLSAFCHSPPAGNMPMSHWGRKRKHANVTLGRKAESGAESRIGSGK